MAGYGVPTDQARGRRKPVQRASVGGLQNTGQATPAHSAQLGPIEGPGGFGRLSHLLQTTPRVQSIRRNKKLK
jgi:hypothetical protein